MMHSILQHDYSTAQIVHITTPVYAPLFLALFTEHLTKKLKVPIYYYDISKEIPDLQAQLSTSFLGNKSFYMLHTGPELAQLSKEMIAFFDSYVGPHTIFLMTGQKDKLRARPSLEQIKLAATIDVHTYNILQNSHYSRPDSRFDPRFTQRLFNSVEHLELDQACLFMQYQLLVGKNSDHFFDHWLARLITPKHSLFALSQYFFARDGKKLFSSWEQLHHLYPLEFWIPFWSEQLWQAIRFCTTVHEKGIVQAKQLQLRLPFSFMQKDWQKHSHVHMVDWYDRLYEIDFAYKNGSLGPWLELWYARCMRSK